MAFRHWCPYSTHTHTTGATRRREWWKFPSFFFFSVFLPPPTCFYLYFPLRVSSRCHWPPSIMRHVWRQSIPIESVRFVGRSAIKRDQSPESGPSLFLSKLSRNENVHFVEPTEKKKKTNLKKEGKESEMRFIRRTECNKTTTKAFSNHFGALRLIAWLARPARSLYMCIYRRSRWRCCQAYRNWWKEKKEGKKRKWEKKKKRSGMNHATGTDPFDSCFHSVPRFSFTSFSLPFFFSIYSSFHFHVHN